MMRRLMTVLVLCAALLGTAGTLTAASAEPPTPDNFDMGGGPSIPPGFIALFVLTAIGGAAVTIWRVSLARDMARESGMDPDRATAVTLLGDDGLDATYLASSLRGRTETPPATTGTSRRPTEDRLRELRSLRDQGLVTSEEYEARRTAILDDL